MARLTPPAGFAPQLVNYECATQSELDRTDGVVYVVRGDTPSPFDDIYKFTDKLYNMGPKAACARLRSLAGSEHQRPICECRASPGSGSPQLCVAHGSPSNEDRTVFTPPSRHSLRQVSPHGADESVSLSSMSASGHRSGWASPASPAHWSYRLPGAESGLPLRLDTSAQVEMGSSFKKPKRGDLFDSCTGELPMDVAVTHCDILDARASEDPHTLIRLRAMAANWSSANRCRVTFVSAKSGVGINSALAHVIKRLYLQRVAAAQQAGAQVGAKA